MKKIILLLFLISILIACKIPSITRNYEYSPNQNCDCIVKSGGIRVGKVSAYSYKRKAKCNRIEYIQIRDSISNLYNQKYSVYDNSSSDVLAELEKKRLDSLIQIMKNSWTHCKIISIHKTQMIGRQDSIVTLELKIKYYNNFRVFHKKLKTEKSLIRL